VSDTRLTLIGIGLIFAGFIVLSVFGGKYFGPSIEAEEFGDCYEYFEDKAPVAADCDILLQGKSMFFGLVIILIGCGIFALIKGVKGRWDQDVKPEDMVGPGGDSTSEKPKPDKKD